MTRRKSHQEGFSLVELAIVLIVIGLIVGGILKGQDLIESARMKSILSQVNDYRVATHTFMDKYDALPGDFNRAQDTLGGDLKDGKNNGVIDGAGLTSTSEAYQFWCHLTAANLISSSGKPVSSGTAHFGQGIPKSKMGGGFTVCHQPDADMPGHWLVLGKERGEAGDGALLTPLQAYSLLKKADDPRPNQGYIRARDGGDVTAGDCVLPSGEFNFQNKKPACILYFQL